MLRDVTTYDFYVFSSFPGINSKPWPDDAIRNWNHDWGSKYG